MENEEKLKNLIAKLEKIVAEFKQLGMPKSVQEEAVPEVNLQKEISELVPSEIEKLVPKERAARAVRMVLFPRYLEFCERNEKLYTLTEQRLKKGVARMLECVAKTSGDWQQAGKMFSRAIKALADSDFHMGRKKDQPKKYNDWIDNFCKSQEQFEKWLAKADEAE